jgi:hypothetical protein
MYASRLPPADYAGANPPCKRRLRAALSFQLAFLKRGLFAYNMRFGPFLNNTVSGFLHAELAIA